MKLLKLYIPNEDLNKYIKKRINNSVETDSFMPISVTINPKDFSIDITVVETVGEHNFCDGRNRITLE